MQTVPVKNQSQNQLFELNELLKKGSNILCNK